MSSFVQIVSCLFDSDYNFHKDENAIRLNTEPDEMFFHQYFLQLVIALDILFQRMFEHIYYLLGQDVHKIHIYGLMFCHSNQKDNRQFLL